MSLKIILEYISEIDFFNTKPINFGNDLKRILSKVSVTNCEIHTWINEDFTDNLITQSQINLRTDTQNKKVFSVITYTLKKQPSTSELEKIIDLTTAQLSDGYGEESLEIILSNKIFYKKKIYIGLLGHGQTYPIKIEKNYANETVIIYEKIECSVAIINAVEQGNLDLVSDYLNTQDSIDCKMADEDSLLIHAIRKKQEKIAFFLIKNGADISNVNKILMHSCHSNLIKLTDFLLDNGADVNDRGLYDTPPLVYAGSNLDLVKLLVFKGANVNAQNNYGRTALSLCNNPDVVNFLLSKGANPSHKSEEGKTPLDYITEDLKDLGNFNTKLATKYKKIIKLLDDHT